MARISLIALLLLGVVVALLFWAAVVFVRSPRSRGPIIGMVLVLVCGSVLLYATRHQSEVRLRSDAEARVRIAQQAARDGSTERDFVVVRAESGTARDGERPATPPVRPPDREAGEVVEVVETLPEPEPGMRTIEVPDDLDRWKRQGAVLGYASASRPPDEPWVDDAAGGARRAVQFGDTLYYYWAPGPDDRLAAYSGSHATRHEAREEAVGRAQAKLSALAVLRVLEQGASRDPGDLLRLARRVVQDIGALEIADEVVERGSLPDTSVPIERVAVLFGAGRPVVERVADETRARLERGWLEKQRARWLDLCILGGGALLAFGVFVVYSLVNAGSKGWFAWPLRLAALCAIVAVVTIVWFLRAKLAVP